MDKAVNRVLWTLQTTARKIKEDAKDKIFLPYSLQKKNVQGWGWLLQDKIVMEHWGYIRVDNNPEEAQSLL